MPTIIFEDTNDIDWVPSHSDSPDENTPVSVILMPPVFSEKEQDMMNVQCICGEVHYGEFDGCTSCGSQEIDGYRITEEAHALISSVEQTKSTVWFHATEREDWEASLKTSGNTVHLGSKASALALMRAENMFREEKECFYLYQVRIDDTATVSPNTCPDLIYSWEEDSAALYASTQHDFVRYVNSCEDAGSVSLIGNPQKMTVIACDVTLP